MSVLNWLKYFFRIKNQELNWSRIKKILIIRNDHIGDLCLTIPFITALKQFRKDFIIELLINEYTNDLVSLNPDIDKIICSRKDEPLESVLKKLSEYDIVFNLTTTKLNARLISKINGKIKIGYAYKFFNIKSCNRFVFVHRQNPPIHETDFCFEYFKTLGLNMDKNVAIEKSHIYIPDEIKNKINIFVQSLKLDKTKKNVGIHPGSKNSAYNWSLKNYINLGELLIEKYNVLYIFGPDEKNFILEFNETQLKKFHFICGDFSLKELCCFISKLDYLISSSTGPMHIAGIMGISTISIFSNKPSHNYLKWHPIKNKYKIIEPKLPYSGNTKNLLMDSIKPETIASELNKI